MEATAASWSCMRALSHDIITSRSSTIRPPWRGAEGSLGRGGGTVVSGKMEAPPLGIKELVDSGLTHVPSKYIYPESRRPLLPTHPNPLLPSIPIIDIAPLSSPGDGRRLLTLQQIAVACCDWGFFQIINHGVPLPLADRVLSALEEYFALPAEERRRYDLDDPRKMRAASANWKETIRCTADESSAPAFLREVALEFEEEVMRLAVTLYGAIIESLGVTPDLEKAKEHIANANMLMHYYPPCPDPSLTFGLSEHTDAGFFTILLQDQVGGLEVLKEGEWIPCKPVPNSFTVNVADQMEILTNGRYKSVLHRVVTNPEKPRLSIACFLAPSMDGKVGPLLELIDDNNPAVYKEVVFGDYIQHYMKARFADTALSGTDFAKLEPSAS
eukprot:c23919_g1_i1 orf=89-1246(+)